VPGLTPVRTPLNDPIVATDVVAELHVPPNVASLNVVEEPAHSELRPDIADNGFTVTGVVIKQLPGSV
jgi:hypothetical protein